MPVAPNETPAIDCRTAIRQLWDYLDTELTDDRMAQVRAHLEICKDCLPHHQFGHPFLEALRRTRDERAAPPQVRQRVLERLRQAGMEGV
jgi:anti-sigma factor (TIGR02949 family)